MRELVTWPMSQLGRVFPCARVRPHPSGGVELSSSCSLQAPTVRPWRARGARPGPSDAEVAFIPDFRGRRRTGSFITATILDCSGYDFTGVSGPGAALLTACGYTSLLAYQVSLLSLRRADIMAGRHPKWTLCQVGIRREGCPGCDRLTRL
ncbi:hypothetical protein BHE74_00037825 [Ensete ventricosum]|nr:hypothetical protein BHE74_00037825 [Ensete ventricosum]